MEERIEQSALHQSMSTKAVLNDLVSGTIAGVISTYVGYPLDLIKVSSLDQFLSVTNLPKV